MIGKILIVAVAIGAASSMSVRRFDSPSFSVQTVHNPIRFNPASGSFFFGDSGASRFHHFQQQHNNVQEGIAQANMIPVMVPVSQDFQGDSIVVTPEQLASIKVKTVNAADILAKAQLINEVDTTQIKQVQDTLPIDAEAVQNTLPIDAEVVQDTLPIDAEVVQDTLTIDTEVIQENELDVQPSVVPRESVDNSPTSTPAENSSPIDIMELEDAVDVTLPASTAAPASVGPLSATDDVVILIDSISTVPTPVSVTEEQTTTQEPSTTSVPIIQPTIMSAQTERVQATAFHESQSYLAHREFLNTWLRLASVNLNRPDLLTLLQPVGTTPAPAVVSTTPISTTTTPNIAAVTEKINTISIQDRSVIDDKLEAILISEPALNDNESLAKEITPTNDFSGQNQIRVENVKQGKKNSRVTEEDQLVEEIIDEILMNEGVIDLATLSPDLLDADSFVTDEALTTFEELPLITESEIKPTEELIPVENDALLAVDSVDPEIRLSPTQVDETMQIAEATQDTEIEQTDAIPQAVESIINDNLPIEKEVNIIPTTTATIPPPFLLTAVPWVSSRGRFSGFRYRFAHRPVKGTFFLNSV